MTYHVCTPENMGPEILKIEMILNSLFDSSYVFEKKSLIINNGNLEFLYTKYEDKYELLVKVISLKEENKKYDLSFVDKKFELNMRNYKSLGVDFFNFNLF